MIKKIAIILLAIALLGVAFWYFVGLAFLDVEVHEEMVGESTVLKRGNFIGIDVIHKGSGDAMVIQKDGSYFVRFENFEVTNGPDLYVYLSKNTQVDGGDKLGEYKDIGRLKGNVGSQNYEISAADVEQYNSVVIWCKRFGVLFSSADLGRSS